MDESKWQPFYVGKGKTGNGRRFDHRKEAEKLLIKPGRKSIKVKIIHKLWKNGLDFEEDIILSSLSEDDSFALEIAAIEQYGRINKQTGCLSNLTDGGEGGSGLIMSEESKRHLSNIHKGMFHTEESKQKMSEKHKGENSWNYGKKCHPETKEKIGRANKGNQAFKGRKHKPESIEKMKKAKKGQMPSQNTLNLARKAWKEKGGHTEEAKERIRQAQQNKVYSPETRQKLSVALKKHWAQIKKERVNNG